MIVKGVYLRDVFKIAIYMLHFVPYAFFKINDSLIRIIIALSTLLFAFLIICVMYSIIKWVLLIINLYSRILLSPV